MSEPVDELLAAASAVRTAADDEEVLNEESVLWPDPTKPPAAVIAMEDGAALDLPTPSELAPDATELAPRAFA